jgi:LmbE family N-acetylglucosaminyl deacetylase
MKYLFLISHQDDETLACGATIHKLTSQGHDVTNIVLSDTYGSVNTTQDFIKAQQILGVNKISFSEFPVRLFDYHRQDITQYLHNQLIDDYDYIFTHSTNDFNTDHKTVAEEALKVFKKYNLITFSFPWNELQSNDNYYIEVSEENMAKKLEAMACYKSQQHRPYFSRDFTYARALLAGAKIGVKYAESFRIVNLRG